MKVPTGKQFDFIAILALRDTGLVTFICRRYVFVNYLYIYFLFAFCILRFSDRSRNHYLRKY
uniref:Uncharacterized protein n=1 Tax=Daphnia magna TaxID=35525 RepID=A0A0P5CAH5_9CRUS